MNRKYTSLQYKTSTEKLRKYFKEVSITTDIIVGFPFETEEEFNETFSFLKEIKLTKTHIFKYSPRTGTKAAEMENQVDGNIKEARSKVLIELSDKNEKEFMNRFVNKNLTVLFEQKVKGKENIYEGYTANYIRVLANSKEDITSKIINTKLIKVEEDYILGEIDE
jgi:threonylcarbamoyladenosine tRNA methylthiotransferase MtaB